MCVKWKTEWLCKGATSDTCDMLSLKCKLNYCVKNASGLVDTLLQQDFNISHSFSKRPPPSHAANAWLNVCVHYGPCHAANHTFWQPTQTSCHTLGPVWLITRAPAAPHNPALQSSRYEVIFTRCHFTLREIITHP